MIISANSEANKEDFNLLLAKTLLQLNDIARKGVENFRHLNGTNLEPFISDIMKEKAIGSAFENSIELVGGQKFPDIIAKKYFGVEVKSTSQNHWKTTGNSVLESTRVKGVEKIYMMFGKLAPPVEFKCRPYEDCLSEVVVTHSPRYLIDMNLADGATIFDKMQVSYDSLRKESSPIKPVVKYYKSKLKPGEDVWWMGQDENVEASNFIIKIWNNLSATEKEELKIKAFAFFPEILGARQDKFNRLAIWLLKTKGVVCPNLRDVFTAGGRKEIPINGSLVKVPQITYKLIYFLEDILSTIENTDVQKLEEFWLKSTNTYSKVEDWITIVSEESKNISDLKQLDLKKIILNTIYK